MAAAKKAAGERALTLHDHIKELRNRFFVVAIVFVLASAIAYNYKDTLLYYLLKPLGDQKLIYLNPAGGFSFIFQVTMYVGVAAAVPFLVYNLYRFVSPALPHKAQKNSAVILIASLFLLAAGVSFGYFFAIPGALHFLNNFAEGLITPNLTADSYLNFILAYTAGLGILFQLPLVLFFIHWIHPLKPLGLLKFERYMILIAFVAAAMITPTPDVWNQTIMAAPIVIMYQIGFIGICISVSRAKRKAKRADAAQPKTTRAELLFEPIPEVVAAAPAPVVAPVSRGYVMEVTAPRKKVSIQVTQPAQQIPAAITLQPPVQASRPFMDVVAPAGAQPLKRSTTVVRPQREVNLRPSMALSVPARPQPSMVTGRLQTIDGFYQPS